MKRSSISRVPRPRMTAEGLCRSGEDGRPRRIPTEFVDEAYSDWVREQPGVYPSGTTPAPSAQHHSRHDENGASLGARLKDDRRSIPMSTENHGHFHALTGPFKGWTRDMIHEWEDREIAKHRSRFLLTRGDRGGL